MIKDKLNALLSLSGKTKVELAQYYGITPQAMQNKFTRGSFSAEDLIKICNFCGASVFLLSGDGQKLILDMQDAEKKSKNETKKKE